MIAALLAALTLCSGFSYFGNLWERHGGGSTVSVTGYNAGEMPHSVRAVRLFLLDTGAMSAHELSCLEQGNCSGMRMVLRRVDVPIPAVFIRPEERFAIPFPSDRLIPDPSILYDAALLCDDLPPLAQK